MTDDDFYSIQKKRIKYFFVLKLFLLFKTNNLDSFVPRYKKNSMCKQCCILLLCTQNQPIKHNKLFIVQSTDVFDLLYILFLYKCPFMFFFLLLSLCVETLACTQVNRFRHRTSHYNNNSLYKHHLICEFWPRNKHLYEQHNIQNKHIYQTIRMIYIKEQLAPRGLFFIGRA